MTAINTIGQPSRQDLSWLSGNARLIDLSGQLLGAHIAHAGLIMFWAGATTISEVARLDLSQPLGTQNMSVLPHLASLGWGVGDGGLIVDTYLYFVVGMLHLAASAVLGAGGLFHVFRSPAKLKDGTALAVKFHYEWSDPKKLSLILGHHLIFLGIAALLFVGKAMLWGGIYDGTIDKVRLITDPNTNPLSIFGYLFGFVNGQWNPLGMAAVNNLEDIIGGHIWIGGMCIIGGAWHIVTEPSGWIKPSFIYNGHGILSYSLAGLAFMAYTSIYFVAYNDLAFPSEFYGIDRTPAAASQFFLCITFLGGHIWHALKAKSQGTVLSDKDKFTAFMAGFLVLAILVIGLVLLSFG
jgi:photosystem II CP43 chlorophyll apoprotein